MSGQSYPLGVMPDIADKRDFPIARFLSRGVSLPPKLDRTADMLPVRDQGQEGTCVAFASCACKESEEEREGYLSTRDIYEIIKEPGGGAYPKSAMEVFLKRGVPPESCRPYTPNVINPPCPNALELAMPNKIKAYARLQTLDEMKQTLCEHGCFMIAVGVTNNWFSVGKDGVLADGDNIIGYHAVALVGYDDEMERVKIRNSWSHNWGENGYGYIGYGMLMRILTDAWSFVDIPESDEEGNEPEPNPLPEPDPKPKPKNPIEEIFEFLRSILKSIFG